jgi:seryl-tRNA synthetase
MAFEYPSTITARKAKEKAKEKEKAKAKEKAKEQEYDDAFSSAKNVIKKLVEKDEDDIKIEIMGNQLDSAFSSENIGKKELSPKSAKK